MTELKHKEPLILGAVGKLLHNSDALSVNFPGGVVTASDEALQVISRYDGDLVDKLPGGIHQSPNRLVGSDRSAFCPIDSPVWKLREVIRHTYGDNRVALYKPAIQEQSESSITQRIKAPSEESVLGVSRELVLATSEKVMFGLELSPAEVRAISEAYMGVNKWFSISAATKGFSDLGRSPKNNYRQAISGQCPVAHEQQGILPALSHLLFGQQQDQFNDQLIQVTDHVVRLWEHLNESNHPIVTSYKEELQKLGLDEEAVILELTNVVGAIISSPPAFLAFSLASFARMSSDEQSRIRDNQAYRQAFFWEIQRLYQSLPWFLRDVSSEFQINNRTYDHGYFIFLTHEYNRRKDIWGENAEEFNPDRFLENPRLAAKSIFFGKGKRRCPGGKFGEAISTQIFESLVGRFEVSASGPLAFNLSESISPRGSVRFSHN